MPETPEKPTAINPLPQPQALDYATPEMEVPPEPETNPLLIFIKLFFYTLGLILIVGVVIFMVILRLSHFIKF